MKHLLETAAILFSLTTWANAQYYVGGFGGYSSSSTVNTLVQGGVVMGEFPTAGITTGTMAGAVVGYTQSTGIWVWGGEIAAAYDFTRQCYSIDCAVERHPGVLLQSVTELGLQFGGLSVLGRLGVANRTLNICAFDLGLLQRDCPNGWTIGPDIGLKLKHVIGAHTDMFFTVDDITWKGYRASTPAFDLLPGFANAATIKNEVVLKLGLSFHLTGG